MQILISIRYTKHCLDTVGNFFHYTVARVRGCRRYCLSEVIVLNSIKVNEVNEIRRKTLLSELCRPGVMIFTYIARNIPVPLVIATKHVKFVRLLATVSSTSNQILEGRSVPRLRVGLVFFCSSRFPDDGVPVPKHVGV